MPKVGDPHAPTVWATDPSWRWWVSGTYPLSSLPTS
jgi:hypothetical protein